MARKTIESLLHVPEACSSLGVCLYRQQLSNLVSGAQVVQCLVIRCKTLKEYCNKKQDVSESRGLKTAL